MVKVLLSDLKPGLALASDIFGHDNHNVPLLRAVNSDTNQARLLNENGINFLKKNGIHEVDIRIDENGFTFPEAFVKTLGETIDTFYEKGDISVIKSYAKLIDALCHEDDGRFRQNFLIDTNKYVYRDENGVNPYKTTGEHVANVVIMSVAIASLYNNIQYEKDVIPVEDVALAAMLSEIGRYANIGSQLEILKKQYKDSDLIKNLEKTVYSNNVAFYQMNGGTVPKPVMTRISDKAFDVYNSKYIPLYSYLLSKKFDLKKSIVSRAILFSGESYSNTNGILGVALAAIKSLDNDINDDTKLGTKSCIISEIIHMCSIYDLALYQSRDNCESNGIMPIYRDVFSIMNRIQSEGYIHPKLLKYLYEIIPCYYVGQIVELNDGTYGRVCMNRFDICDPVIEDVNGNIIEDNVSIIGPRSNNPYVFIDVPNESKKASGL